MSLRHLLLSFVACLATAGPVAGEERTTILVAAAADLKFALDEVLVGDQAPDFTLPNQDGEDVSLAALLDRKLVLAFYPADFSPVCTDQLSVYEQVMPQIVEQGARVVGISVDSTWSHKAFQEKLGISIPLLSDFHPRAR